MSPRRVAFVACGGALAAAWLAAATTAPGGDVAGLALPPPVVATGGGGEEPATAAAELAADIERLRRRLAQAPDLRMGARNPFSLAAPPPPRPDAVDPPRRRSAPAVARRPPAMGPAVELIGIATAVTQDGPERTGILSTRGGEVFLVRTGDRVAGGYRVEAVESSSVTLVDGNGASHRLALPY